MWITCVKVSCKVLSSAIIMGIERFLEYREIISILEKWLKIKVLQKIWKINLRTDF